MKQKLMSKLPELMPVLEQTLKEFEQAGATIDWKQFEALKQEAEKPRA